MIPVFNGEKYIEEAIASVLAQKGAEIEVIVVDDGSTDGTAEILKRFSGQVRLGRQDNAGPSAARNAGLRVARGEWIGFLDADDTWPEGKIASHLAQLSRAPQAEVAFGWTQPFRLSILGEKENVGPPHFFLNVGSSLFRREVFEKVGLFDESLAFSEDVDWFMRARDKGTSIDFSEDVVLHYRLHSEGLSQQRGPGGLQLTQVLHKALQRRREQKGVL